MARNVPVLAVLLGVAGLVPFALCGLASVSANFLGAQIAVQLMIAYGAVVLSFLGGVHWGVSLTASEGSRQRLTLGVAPGLLGWLTLVISFYGNLPSLGVTLLIALFIAAAVLEWRGHLNGGIPASYVVLRVAVTVAICTILIPVLVLRLTSAHLLI